MSPISHPLAAAAVLILGPTALPTAQGGAGQYSPGFTLFAPISSTDTHLIDEAGSILHTWPSSYSPGNAVYMLENGNLLRTVRSGTGGTGGTGGGVQEVAWDGTVLWDFDYSNSSVLQHHDVEPLPNGNVLMIAWEHKTKAQAVSQGRKPFLVQGTVFSPEHIIEIQPTGPTSGLIVWEWHVWDHLVQDFDPSKPNFGVVADHPELVDINFPHQPISGGDWIHANSIDYHPDLDQIVISCHNLNEIWIIDHSTTTAEAAGHTGGNSGMGGDILYRWGNPQAYDAGTPADAQLSGQHDANWIEPGFPGEGNLLVFNNRAGGAPGNLHSSVVELATPVDANGHYPLSLGSAHGPAAPTWEYTAPVPTDFYSANISGAVRLPNGNTLVCSGAQGWFFEVTQSKQVVWEYLNTLPTPNQNIVFKVRRYERQLWSSQESLSASAGGAVDLALVAGTEHASQPYLLLGSAGGTSPAVVVDGQSIPLNVSDPYFLLTLTAPNSPPLSQSFGTLDSTGSADASFTLGAGVLPPGLVGVELNHAFVVFDLASGTVALASNAVPLALDT